MRPAATSAPPGGRSGPVPNGGQVPRRAKYSRAGVSSAGTATARMAGGHVGGRTRFRRRRRHNGRGTYQSPHSNNGDPPVVVRGASRGRRQGTNDGAGRLQVGAAVRPVPAGYALTLKPVYDLPIALLCGAVRVQARESVRPPPRKRMRASPFCLMIRG